MLEPTIKGEGVTETEKRLARIAEETFFSLWSYPNPYRIDKKGKKELCDLLIVFDKTLIIFSDKGGSFNTKIDIAIAWKRWFRNSVLASVVQLHGAESSIRSEPNNVYLDPQCTIDFPIPLDENPFEIHLIAVTYNSVRSTEKYFGNGSSGSLLHVYPQNVDECLNNPFTIGDLYPKKTFVHILDVFSLDLLIDELSTISDFIAYLREKERAVRQKQVVLATGEEELLALFLNGRDQSNTSGKFSHAINKSVTDGSQFIMEGLWIQFKSSTLYQLHSEMIRSSEFWDSLISSFSNHIIDGRVGAGQELEFENHERAIRHLASENRLARYLLSIHVGEKFNLVPPDVRSSRLCHSPTYEDKLYIFLFFPRSEEGNYANYRKERLLFIKGYGLVAKYLHPEKKDIVVIATEPQLSNGRSEDIACFEYDEELTEEDKALAQKLMNEKKILNKFQNNSSILNTRRRHKKYKGRNGPKIGRNSKCPCGSGKKFKNCCL